MTGSEHSLSASPFSGAGRVLSGWDFGCGFAFLSPSAFSGHTAGLWPLASEEAGRPLPARPQPAEQGGDLLSPVGGREERVQVCESSPSGLPGSRKCPKH